MRGLCFYTFGYFFTSFLQNNGCGGSISALIGKMAEYADACGELKQAKKTMCAVTLRNVDGLFSDDNISMVLDTLKQKKA